MTYKNVFKMPANTKITGRTSTVTNAFVSSILPSIDPEEMEIEQCLKILELDLNGLRCAYCGDSATEWDHLHPLVSDKKPTGYISEIRNLVPACGRCNQSKGNKKWEYWIVSDAKGSPKMRGVKDLKMKIERLQRYEKWGRVSPFKLDEAVNKELWDQHWQNCENMHRDMKRCQKIADRIKIEIEKSYQLGKLPD